MSMRIDSPAPLTPATPSAASPAPNGGGFSRRLEAQTSQAANPTGTPAANGTGGLTLAQRKALEGTSAAPTSSQELSTTEQFFASLMFTAATKSTNGTGLDSE